MEEAVDKARNMCLDEGKVCALAVLNNGGTRTDLALYSPIKVGNWEDYRQDPSDKDSPLVPQVCVELHLKHERTNPPRTIDAILHKGPTKGKDFYTLKINGKPDPANRTFQGAMQEGHRTARQDLETWFQNMKDHGFFPLVKEIKYQTL